MKEKMQNLKKKMTPQVIVGIIVVAIACIAGAIAGINSH